MVLFPMGARTGAVFTSVTTIVIVCAALKLPKPLSFTRTVTAAVLGPWASLGVQVNMPVAGSMLAPAGAPGSRLKVKVCAGLSASVAEAVKVKRLPSLIVLLLSGTRTGAMLGWEIPIMPDERETGMITRFPSAASTGVGELSIE